MINFTAVKTKSFAQTSVSKKIIAKIKKWLNNQQICVYQYFVCTHKHIQNITGGTIMQTSELIKKLQGSNTNAKISDISGFHVNTISKWRTGGNEPNYFSVVTFAESCGYEILFMKKNKIDKIELVKKLLAQIADETIDDLELQELENAYTHITSLEYMVQNDD